MFDISIGKLIIIAAVAFIVIGPERLPKVAKTVGLILGRLQRYIAGIKNELHQEIEKAEFSKIEEEFRTAHTQMKKAIQDSVTVGGKPFTVKDHLAEQGFPADCAEPLLPQPPQANTAPKKALSTYKPCVVPVSISKEEQLDLFDEVPIKQPISTAHRDRR